MFDEKQQATDQEPVSRFNVTQVGQLTLQQLLILEELQEAQTALARLTGVALVCTRHANH